MSIFSRLSDIINANLNALLDKAEDPEKMIRLIIKEMEDTLVEVRSSTVGIIAEKKEIERKAADVRREGDEWERKAEVALLHGREDLAKAALMAKAKAYDGAAALAGQLAPREQALTRSDQDIQRLQDKLNDARNREQAIVARRQAAANRIRVREKLHDQRINRAFARFEQAERGLDELEGKVEAFDLGRGGKEGKGRSLAEEILELDVQDKAERDLAELKARMAARRGS